VFAVVQHQHGPFGTECRSQLTAADPAETESVRDRRHDTGGIERGGQRHPAHMKVSIGSQLPNDLHGEPRLAGTPDTADRDHTRRSEQVGELGAFPLASNEPSEIGRQRVPEELGIDRHSTPHRFLGSALAARTYSDDRTGVHSCALSRRGEWATTARSAFDAPHGSGWPWKPSVAVTMSGGRWLYMSSVRTHRSIDSTLIAGSEYLAAHLMRTDVLETWRVQSHDSLAEDADLLNQIDSRHASH
jgi:hypothetical protein